MVVAGALEETELLELAEPVELVKPVDSVAPAHWQSPSTLHGHHVWPEAHALHCSVVAAWTLPGTATHSLQQSSLQLLHSTEADVLVVVGAGVVCADVGAGVDEDFGAAVDVDVLVEGVDV